MFILDDGFRSQLTIIGTFGDGDINQMSPIRKIILLKRLVVAMGTDHTQNRDISVTGTGEDLIDETARSLSEDGTIPISLFNNDEIYEQELVNLFFSAWNYIGHESEIPEPGDYVRRYIVDDPLIFVRDEDGDIHVHYDSCRHRGSQVVQAEKGNTSHFRCPYHGWTYKTNGELIGVPKKQSAYNGLDRSEWGLISVPKVATYRGFVFASLDTNAPSFDSYLGDAKWYFDLYANFTEQGLEVVGDPMRVRVNQNWKIGTENQGGDWYHAPVTHQSFIESGIDKEGEDEKIDYNNELTVKHIGDCGKWTGVMSLIPNPAPGQTRGLDQYPAAVRESLNPELTEGQRQCLAQMKTNVSNLFPNLSFFHVASDVSDAGEDIIRYIILRKWRPRGPEETEFWNWVLVPKETSDEYKEKAYRNAAAWDGTSGIVEQDDISVAEGITEASGSILAQREGIELNYQMGLESASSEPPVDDEWPGPGTVYDELTEEYSRTFYRNWLELISP